MKHLITIATALLLAACVSAPPAPPAHIQREADAPLICTTEAQCSLYWQRGQVWISQNGAYKFKTISDTIVETYDGAGDGTPRLVFGLIREPRAGGSSRIYVRAVCQNMFGCERHPMDAIAAAKRYMLEK